MEKFREKALIEGGVDMNAAVAKYPSVKLTPLYRAVSNFNLLVIKTFIEAGVDVNARDEYGNTLLHGAASNSNSSMIMRLLKLGADPGARDNKGRTPFDCLRNNKWLEGTDAYELLKEAAGSTVAIHSFMEGA